MITCKFCLDTGIIMINGLSKLQECHHCGTKRKPYEVTLQQLAIYKQMKEK